MRGIEFYDRLIDWPGQSAITELMAAGVALIVLAVTLLSLGRLRWTARGMGVAGVLSLMVAMLLIHEQQVVERRDQFVTVKHWRYPEAARFQVRVALLGLPAAAAFVMMQILWTTQKRQRSTVPVLLKEGRVSMVRGDNEGALTAFNEAIKIAPYLGEAYYLRACAYQAEGRTDEALEDLNQGLRCDPQLSGAYLLRGRLYTQRGELDVATADLDRFMTMRPNDIEGYLHRGVCLAKKGFADEAIADFQRVLKLTNHSDYADPARTYLKQLHAEALAVPTLESVADAAVESMLDAPPRYDDKPELSEERP